MITKQDEKKIGEIIGEAIKDTLMPALERMHDSIAATQKGVKDLGVRMDRLETRIDQIDRKLDFVTDKVFIHDNQLSDHDKRLKKMEKQILTS